MLLRATDAAKLKVITMPALQTNTGVTRGLGFYDKNQPGGAFANTFESRADINYKGQKSRFVELLWQAEKLMRYSKNPTIKNNYAAALGALEKLKSNNSWWANPRLSKSSA